MVFALAKASNVYVRRLRTCLHAYMQNAILYVRTHAYNYSYVIRTYVGIYFAPLRFYS